MATTYEWDTGSTTTTNVITTGTRIGITKLDEDGNPVITTGSAHDHGGITWYPANSANITWTTTSTTSSHIHTINDEHKLLDPFKGLTGDQAIDLVMDELRVIRSRAYKAGNRVNTDIEHWCRTFADTALDVMDYLHQARAFNGDRDALSITWGDLRRVYEVVNNMSWRLTGALGIH